MSQELINIKLKMLNEFKRQFNEIFNLYSKNSLATDEFKTKIRNLIAIWGLNRMDFKNHGEKDNQLEFTQHNQGIRISKPNWMKNDEGTGYTISSRSGKENLVLKCVNNGNLRIIFRAMDYRDINNKRIPVYIDYYKIVINNENVLNTHKLAWHNEPISFSKKCNNSDEFHIMAHFHTIFDFYPKLRNVFDNIQIKKLKVDQDFINKYIDCEIMFLNFNETNESNKRLFNFFKENEEFFDNDERLLDSYNDFANFLNNYEEYQQINKQTEYLTNKIEYLEDKLNRYERLLDIYSSSSNDLFNTIFLDYKLKPNKLYNNIQTLCYELLKFMGNICSKYDINWWVDFGNLLGSVRHENFVPWDDDLDIGMMREDYHKLISVMYDEVEEHNLADCINIYYRHRKYNAKQVNSFAQLFVMDRKRAGERVMAGLDVFPYDYLVTKDVENFGQKYNNAQRNFYNNLTRGDVRSKVYMGLDYEDVIGKYYSELNLSYEKQPYIIPGVEGAYGYRQNLYELKVFKTEQIFPLTEVTFGDNKFPAPNDLDGYLTNVYGNYMNIPKNIRCHGRVSNFRKVPNINETLQIYIDRFKEVNNNF